MAFNCKLLEVGAEAILVSSPEGYSPLGLLRNELAEKSPSSLEKLDAFCEEYNKLTDFSLCAFELSPGLHIILAPNENSNFYKQNSPVGEGIWSDFVYASTFCSLVLASHIGIRKLALTHSLLEINNKFINSMLEAINNYTSKFTESTIAKIIFTGCCFKGAGLENSLTQPFIRLHSEYPQMDYRIENHDHMICMKISMKGK